MLAVTLSLNAGDVFAYNNITESVAAERAEQVSDVRYTLSLKMDQGAATISGTNLIDLTVLQTDKPLVLDFDGPRVNAVAINGEPVSDFRHDTEQDSIVLPKGRVIKGANQISISFEAAYTHSGSGLHQFVDPVDNREYYYSDFQTAYAMRMFPNFDQPDIKAVFELDVDAPKDWTVISNMPVAKSRQYDGRRHSHFQPTLKISSYIMHLSAGPWAMWEDNSGKYPMRLYARQSLAEYVDHENLFDTTAKGMAFFEQYFDMPYPFGKYDQIFAPEFNAGAMENAGAVTVSEGYVFRSKPTADNKMNRDMVIMHELAHMWFGNMVTMKWWNDLWLNESFASFMGYWGLIGIGQDKDKVWARANRSAEWGYFEDQVVTTHPILTEVPDIMTASAIFDGITYSKGLSVLRQLQYYIGEETFREGIRRYIKGHAYGNTTLEDFMAALESAHGKSLDDWVIRWLERKDVNAIKLSWAVKEGKIDQAKVTQSAGRHDPTLRPHANLMGLYKVKDGQLQLMQTVKVLFDGAEQALPALDGKPVPDLILPNMEGHDYVKVRFDDRSMQWLKHNLAKVVEPVTKAIIWRTLWDMVRDQELAADEYYRLAIDRAGVETNPGILNTINGDLRTVAINYTPDTERELVLRKELFALARTRVSEVAPGSDIQRSWYDMMIATAVTGAHLDWLLKMYDGKAVVKGLEMNFSRKWTILTLLAANDRKGDVDPRLAVLSKEDTSARGRNSQLTIQGAYPLLAVKQQTWAALTEGSDYSLHEKSALASHFYDSQHPELALPFIAKYFKHIEQLHRQGASYDLARRFIWGLFPDQGEDETVKAAHKFLVTSEVPVTYKNVVRKALDELERTLAVRKRNLL